MIWSLIVGAIIGVIAGAITNKGKSMGWIANILAGLVGAAVGQGLLGTWGTKVSRNGSNSLYYRCCHRCSCCFILFR